MHRVPMGPRRPARMTAAPRPSHAGGTSNPLPLPAEPGN
jgi:hypothetical protein